MDKINYNVHLIPLKNNKTNSLPMNNMSRTPFMPDPSIIPRVQKYLETNEDKTYIDINVMADELQNKYKEYSRRKRSAFRAAVKKAYSVVLQSYNMNDPDSEEDVIGDDSEPDYGNAMSNQVCSLYSGAQAALRPRQIDENELIDISSDDSEDEQQGNKETNKSNGPPTSQNDIKATNLNNKNDMDNKLYSQNRKRKLEATLSPIKTVSRKKKNSGSTINLDLTRVTFKKIGGSQQALGELCKLLCHLKQPEIYKNLRIRPPTGILLYGPPGVGKTLVANAIAGEFGIPIVQVAATELLGVYGEIEDKIRELFDRAINLAPCILFIDEMHSISQNKENPHMEMEHRIVSQLSICFDELSCRENGDSVVVIGATNRLDAVDLSLRRKGRFVKEICLRVPNKQERLEILKVLTSNMSLTENFNFARIATNTPGYVGADLDALVWEAAILAVMRVLNNLKDNPKLETHLKNLNGKLDESRHKRPRLDTSNDKSDDAEIIVEDDMMKPADTSSSDSNSKQDTSDNAVLVVDLDEDTPTTNTASTSTTNLEPADASTQPSTDTETIPIVESDSAAETAPVAEDLAVVEKPVEQVNSEVTTTEPEPMPVDIVKTTSLFDLLLYWMHEKPIKCNELKDACMTEDDFLEALKTVQQAAKTEGFDTVPDVTWDDIGALRDVKELLQLTILNPIRYAEEFKALDVTVPSGVLLCGPPGCGKTLLAKAVANEAGINFISVKGPELRNMFIGESDKAVKLCFERAKSSAPSLIFFDEIDALCPNRSDSGESAMKVVIQMLKEMDNKENRKNVFVIAASNRPDLIDPAMLRPGRLDEILYVGLPTPEDRVEILKTITKNGTKPIFLSPDVDLNAIGQSERCNGYTGADLAALVRKAKLHAMQELSKSGDIQKPVLLLDHFVKAFLRIRPSVLEKDLKHYEKWKKLYPAVPDDNAVEEMEYS